RVQRKPRTGAGAGPQGTLPAGKGAQIRTPQAFPYMKQNDCSGAASHAVDALAASLEKDASAAGDAAPAKDAMRGGTGKGMRGYGAAAGYGGLAITILCMAGFAVLLASSGARRRFPGKRTQLAGGGLTVASVASLAARPSG